MRRLPLVTVCCLLLVSCGGGSKKSADPGREAIDKLVSAAATGDTAAMWNLLSRASQKRLGPTLADFGKGSAKMLEQQLAPFHAVPFRTLVSELVSTEVGVVAIRDGTSVYAVPLEREGGGLRAELGGPLRIEPLGPKPGLQRDRVQQVAIRIRGGKKGEALGVVLWLDGVKLDGRAFGTAADATVFSNLDAAAGKGSHSVVAIANSGADASALAWVFRVR